MIVRAKVIGLETNGLFVRLDLVVKLARVAIGQSQRVVSIGGVVRIEFDRLAISCFSFAILLQAIVCEPDVEIGFSRGTNAHSLLRSFDCFGVAAQLFVAEARLRPCFGVTAVGFRRLLKVRQSLFAIIFRKKTEPVAKQLHGLGVFVAAGGRDQLAQQHRLPGLRLRRAIQLRDAFRRNREVDALSAGDLQRGDADHLALHVYDRTAARARRNRRGDLNDAPKAGDVAHGGHDSIRHAAFQAERIADYHDAFALLRRGAIKRERTNQVWRRVNLQQCQITLRVNRRDTLDLKSITGVEVNFGAIRSLDHVAIGDDSIEVDEKAAAARKLFAARIERFNRHRGRLDATHEIGKLFLGVRWSSAWRDDETVEEKG